MSILRRALRILAITGKEVVETVRRPSALLSVIGGPVLILALFGLGFVGQPALRATLVVPLDAGLPVDPSAYASVAPERATIVGVTSDAGAARAQLRSGATDLVVIAPRDWRAELAAGHQAVLEVAYDTVSPYRSFVAHTAANTVVSGVNRLLIQAAAQRAADEAAAAGRPLPPDLRPELIAEPTRADIVDLAPSAPAIVPFYGTMVLALIVQHLAITLAALSMLHDRRRGMLDLFRMSPVGSADLLAGKYAALLLLGTGISLAVLALLVGGLGVPALSGPGAIVGTIALLVVASVGIGIVVALVSDTERQAVQVALLVLLASVFFSGLALDLDQFSVPVRALGQLLPVTQAGTLLQDLMLRGSTGDPWRFAVLGALAAGLFVAGWLILGRQLRRPG